MAVDVFGIDTQIGGAWQIEGAVLNIEDAEDLVVTSANLTYRRTTSKFSPLNQKKKYMVTGEADGQITLGAVIGPSKDIKTFLERYSYACNLQSNVLSLQPAGKEACEDGFEGIEFKCTGVLINNLNVSVTQIGSNMTMVNAGLAMNFIALQVL